jgi:hypothetical protein
MTFVTSRRRLRPGAEPQARKNRRITRWKTNTVKIFSGRERGSWSRIVRHGRKVSGGQALSLQIGR